MCPAAQRVFIFSVPFTPGGSTNGRGSVEPNQRHKHGFYTPFIRLIICYSPEVGTVIGFGLESVCFFFLIRKHSIRTSKLSSVASWPTESRDSRFDRSTGTLQLNNTKAKLYYFYMGAVRGK